jgi:polyisoprenoid-binding protein YceI
LGKKVTGQHNGTVALKSGKVDLDGKTLKGGKFEIDMNSIVVEDLKDPTYNAKLTGHLKSDDFFGVAKFPTSTFVITSVKPVKNEKDATHEITGDLTIKGITQPVTFPAKVEFKDGEAHAKGKAMVDRTKYNIRYGSGKFFENLGDKMISDNFEMDLDLAAKL